MNADIENSHLGIMDLASIVTLLVNDQRLSSEDGDNIIARHQDSEVQRLHPFELIAADHLPDLADPTQTLTIEVLCHWWAEFYQLEYVHIDPLLVDVAVITQVMSQAFAQRHHILALSVTDDEVVIATAQPGNGEWQENLSHVTRKQVRQVVASPEDIRKYTLEFYHVAQSMTGAQIVQQESGARTIASFEQLLELGNIQSPTGTDQHTVSIVDWLLQYAFEQRASDIHLEPRRNQTRLRFRIDGVLHTIYLIPAIAAQAVTSRLKILARMDVAEKRKPQDGRMKTKHPKGREVELRLATLPTIFGEKLVIRIFDPEILLRPLSDMGFNDSEFKRWDNLINKPSGLILVTGPTGSGKTTTLYSTLKSLVRDEVNICTIEDPVEMVEPDFNQTQVQPLLNMGFANGLRALLRQDPDIIMVGEIRDRETAQMAMDAAMTGHLVFATLHTNDAASALTRFMELGVPSYLIKNTVLGVMAQRLVRELCPHCKENTMLDPMAWKMLTHPYSTTVPRKVYEAKGCNECRQTGYQGRTGIYELMVMSDALKMQLNGTPDTALITQLSIKEGMFSLRLSGAAKITEGVTSMDEVLRVTAG